jgi:hypothetical protein
VRRFASTGLGNLSRSVEPNDFGSSSAWFSGFTHAPIMALFEWGSGTLRDDGAVSQPCCIVGCERAHRPPIKVGTPEKVKDGFSSRAAKGWRTFTSSLW